MKWYQHDSNCHNDEKIRHLIHDQGLEAYAVYHICLELIAEKIDESQKHWIEISERVLCEKLCMRLTRVERMLNSSSFQVLLKTHNEHGMFILSCPNLLKRLDNWTKRSVVATEQVPLQLESNKKENKKRELFTPPSLEDVKNFASEISSKIDPEVFFNHYEGNGWRIGKVSMKNWKATLKNWDKRESKAFTPKKVGPTLIGAEMYGKI